MLKKTIKYNDLDGNEIVEDFYFHLSKAELAEMNLRHNGGMEQYLKAIITSNHGGLIIDAFKEIITKAYGKRSEDNRSFLKSDQMLLEFIGTDAYSELFMELCTNANAASEFVNGIMPKDLADKAKVASGELEQSEVKLPDAPKQKKINEYTDAELLAMPKEEFEALMDRTKPTDMSKDHLVIAMHRKSSGK